MHEQTRLIIVSGLSGSGKTVALHTLEDNGCYCIDNLPVTMLAAFGDHVTSLAPEALGHYAVGVDARNRMNDLEAFPEILAKLKRVTGIQPEILFLTADESTLIKRFSETRRRHPLSSGDVPLADAIARERALLVPIQSQADLVIDTTETTLHQLRDLVRQRLTRNSRKLSLLFQSFGFKHGAPTDADFVFDARVLPNPHWEPALRALTGQDEPVARYLSSHESVETMYTDIRDFLDRWVPAFKVENRSYLTVAIGCTGGQHRSVYLCDRLASHFDDGTQDVSVRHRELS
ncbi:RNase adapter RapZ [Aquisalimonas sp. 2447]|uniref:RNase adapter RapZ n=1 Tax=Aquisalimonas sp. 2447 TaxID=2740807 RepID=UPI0014326DEE|nr:RNase adapter RapZ [Aquisalimonas sp. 2447]QIT56316.1 RNase adapter RapZ [Aquisalimonas sp. 2447]